MSDTSLLRKKTQWSFLLSSMETEHFPFSWTLCHWMEVFAIDQPTYLICRETKLAWKGDDDRQKIHETAF